MAEINKPLTWATPSGTRWVNRYYEPEYGYSDYYTERGRKQHRFIADDSDETDRKRAVRSVAPNVIHSCDASHAIFTINACAAEDIEVATNHDCFSMLAPDAKRFNEIVREQFVRLHERDLLGEIRAALRRRALPNCLLFQDAASFPSVPFWEPSTSFPSHPAHHNTDGCPLGHRASMEF
jgi:DNA-directed RNA polymerase